MLLNQKWKRKIRDHEDRIHHIMQKNEIRKLEHLFLAFKREYQEERTAPKLSTPFLHREDSSHSESNSTFDSYGLEKESEVLFGLPPTGQEDENLDKAGVQSSIPCPNPEVTSCLNLFHETLTEHEACELNEEPNFDSYDHEVEEVSSLGTITGGKCSNDVLEPLCADLEHQGTEFHDFDSSPLLDTFDEVEHPFYDEHLEILIDREPESLAHEADQHEDHEVHIGSQVGKVLQTVLEPLSSEPTVSELPIIVSPLNLIGNDHLGAWDAKSCLYLLEGCLNSLVAPQQHKIVPQTAQRCLSLKLTILRLLMTKSPSNLMENDEFGVWEAKCGLYKLGGSLYISAAPHQPKGVLQSVWKCLSSEPTAWGLPTKETTSNLIDNYGLSTWEAKSTQISLEGGLNQSVATHNMLFGVGKASSYAKPPQPMLWSYFVVLTNTSPIFESSGHSRRKKFKNCYSFNKEGAHSVPNLRGEAGTPPGVHHDPISGNFAAIGALLQSIRPIHLGTSTTTRRGHWIIGNGLLDYYIENDELKDKLRSCCWYYPLKCNSHLKDFKLQDLRSNLHQPGVFDAGTSWGSSSNVKGISV